MHTSTLARWAFCTAALFALGGCGGGGTSSSTDPATGQPQAVRTMQARGVVVDDVGIPLANATVTVVSSSTVSGTDARATTNSDGAFTLVLDAATPAVLRADKAGYASNFGVAPFAALNASAGSRMVLQPVASTQTFDPTQDAVLRVPGTPARVTLAASSLVREDGQPISGTTSVALTPIDPSVDIARMPGLMVDAASGEPIESLGAFSVTFTDASGASLNLASGQTATIRIPATPAAGATLPATFPLYHLNETTGRWTREGTATLQTDPATGAKYYEGTVSHFSKWNADQPFNTSMVEMTQDKLGNTCSIPEGFRVEMIGQNYSGRSVAWIQGGNFPVRALSRVRANLMDASGLVADTIEFDSSNVGGAMRLARCLSPQPKVTLSGRVTVTSGVLSNYWVQISDAQASTDAVPISSDGSYSTRVYANRGTVVARLVLMAATDLGTPDTSVTTTVASANASFPDLTVQDTRFNLSGCVQGWESYRQSRAQVSLFLGNTRIGQPQTVQSSRSNFAFNGLPLSSTLTLRLTAPDATLAEKVTELVVGSTPPAQLGACLVLPKAATPVLQASGSGRARNFDASSSTAGDAAITTYAWSFGDGSTATGATVSHSYSVDGTYIVTLIVTDQLGQVSRVTTTQTLGDIPLEEL